MNPTANQPIRVLQQPFAQAHRWPVALVALVVLLMGSARVMPAAAAEESTAKGKSEMTEAQAKRNQQELDRNQAKFKQGKSEMTGAQAKRNQEELDRNEAKFKQSKSEMTEAQAKRNQEELDRNQAKFKQGKPEMTEAQAKRNQEELDRRQAKFNNQGKPDKVPNADCPKGKC